MSVAFPEQLITNTETKDVLLTPELEAALPTIEVSLAAVDAKFEDDPYKYLRNLQESQFMAKTENGPEVACSLLMNDGQQSDELMVVFAPFADRDPKTDADTMWSYTQGDPTVSRTEAKPNSWNQTTKSAVTTDLLEALGHGMPVLTIFAPVPTKAYSKAERGQFKDGDFTPSGRLAIEAMSSAINGAQLRVHGLNSPEQFTKIHLSGASLGASNAIGAANRLIAEGYDVQSTTAQELIMSPTSVPDLGKRFTIGGITGEASTTLFPEHAQVLGEAALRRAIDGKGSEIIGMNLRMIQGASKLPYMKGMTKPQATLAAVEKLWEGGVNLLVATADNSALSDKTRELLPSEVPQIRLTPQESKKLGHIADEYVTLSALVVALNVAKSRS